MQAHFSLKEVSRSWRFRSEKDRTWRRLSGSSDAKCSGPESWLTCVVNGTTKSQAPHGAGRRKPRSDGLPVTHDVGVHAPRPDLYLPARDTQAARGLQFPPTLLDYG